MYIFPPSLGFTTWLRSRPFCISSHLNLSLLSRKFLGPSNCSRGLRILRGTGLGGLFLKKPGRFAA